MATFNQDAVKTCPMTCKSHMNLEQIRKLMEQNPPSISGFKGGWASVSDYQSNLGTVGLEPPKSAPGVFNATDSLPEMLVARYYFWDTPRRALREAAGYDPATSRVLTAVDVTITKPRDDLAGILLSTRTMGVLGGEGRVLEALEDIFKTQDKSLKIDRRASHLHLADEEFFLWLAVRHRDDPTLSADLTLDLISGISSRDEASRTASLRSGIDFERAQFLTSVAESDTLGPIDVSLVNVKNGENHSYEVRIHIDGGFEIRKNAIRIPDSINQPNFMLETVLYIAYCLIPEINKMYVEDTAAWQGRRVEVIKSAMTALEQRYSELKALLDDRLGVQSDA